MLSDPHSTSFAYAQAGKAIPTPGRPFPDVPFDVFAAAFLTDPAYAETCSEFCTLIRIAVTHLVHTSTNEQLFSSLNLIMTKLRNRLSQPMLDALMRIAWYPDKIENCDLEDMVDFWFSLKNRRSRFRKRFRLFPHNPIYPDAVQNPS